MHNVFILSLTELLERVFLRLGVAEGDDKLESCLSRFLIPTILKITSPHKPVQDKVRAWLSACCWTYSVQLEIIKRTLKAIDISVHVQHCSAFAVKIYSVIDMANIIIMFMT